MKVHAKFQVTVKESSWVQKVYKTCTTMKHIRKRRCRVGLCFLLMGNEQKERKRGGGREGKERGGREEKGRRVRVWVLVIVFSTY